MLDVTTLEFDPSNTEPQADIPRRTLRTKNSRGKRVFDIAFCILLLPVFLTCSFFLLFLNPFGNRGALFFVQTRMGRDCRPFPTIKFRTMRVTQTMTRSADGRLETDRITPLGRFLRRSRIDELPQILNVLRGEMSLIGPRPDYFEHAAHYLCVIPGYRQRLSVRPGISGLAQTQIGYVEGIEATRRKVNADLYYISHGGPGLEVWIFWRTLAVILGRAGS
jgi:lipopolysaccharide/colanic/teichoic acid biosynthesis glycosyltransferase